MIPLGLKRSEYKKYVALLGSPHWIHVRIQMMDLSHKYIGDLSNRLLDGQVNIDSTAAVTRSLQLSLFDPHRSMRIAGDDPDDGAVFVDRMIRVVYSVAPPDKSVWYSVPVFCGPISKTDRESSTVHIEAQGKETLAFQQIWSHRTYRKGLKKTTALRRIMSGLAGESRFQIPDLRERLPKHLSLGPDTTPWKAARSLARGLDRMLFYDGRGVLVLRKRSPKSVFTFDGGMILSEPQLSFDTTKLRNSVLLVGGKPKGSKKKISVRRVAPRNHPFSPWKLGRNGVPRYIPEIIRDESIRTRKKGASVANHRLRNALLEGVDASFDCLPVPHLEPGDVFRVRTDDYATSIRMSKMTIPLTATGTASIGVLKRTSPRTKRSTRVRKH